MNTPKATKKVAKVTKSCRKNAIKDPEQVSLIQDHEFLCWLMSLKTIVPRMFLSFVSVICFVRWVSQKRKSENKIESLKILFHVDTDKTIHNTKKLQLYMLHCPVTKHFCLALCTVKCGLVCEWVTRKKPQSFINEMSNFWAAVIIRVFEFLIQEIAKTVAFFFFCKVMTLYISEKNNGNLIVIQTSTAPHNFVQISCTSKACFLGLYFFGGGNEYPWTFSSIEQQ